MKTVKVLLAATALVGFAASAQALTIVNTKHDLSSNGGATSIRTLGTNQTCVFCHAPHNAAVNKLLWNRVNTPAGTTMKIYTSFNTTAMRTALGAANNSLADNSNSLLCLSCHALGTVQAIFDNVKNPTGLTATASVGVWSSRTGNMTNLTNDHPVGIDYSAAAATATTTALVAPSGGKVAGLLRLFQSDSGTNQMECASCHSVHDNTYGKFLATTNSGSNLCRTCHVK